MPFRSLFCLLHQVWTLEMTLTSALLLPFHGLITIDLITNTVLAGLPVKAGLFAV